MFSKFSSKEIAFALITFYPKWYPGKLKNISDTEKIRGDLALEFIKKASDLGYRIVVVEGKSSENFRKRLDNFPGIKIIKRTGYKRSPARRQGFKAASKIPGVKIIITTEAEKVSLLDSIKIITEPILNNEADLVIPQREAELFKKTFPDYMYDSETEGIGLYTKQLILHKLLPQNSPEIDIFFGPRVFANTPKVLSLFTKKYLSKTRNLESKTMLDPEESSNALYFPVVMALKKGFRVKTITIAFSYPPLQKENETRGERKLFEQKRKDQKISILLELRELLIQKF